jgi:hypothetical protein
MLTEFPELRLEIVEQERGHVEISVEAPTASRAKALTVLTCHKGDVWVRFAPPRAFYPIDDEKELVRIVKDLLAEQALFVVITCGNEWAGTTLTRPGTKPTIEGGKPLGSGFASGDLSVKVSPSHHKEVKMALPQLVMLAVEKKLSDYCRKKVPPHVSDKLRISFRIRGNNVTLLESRPFYADPNHWTEMVVAQFRFDPETADWTLYWPDRNSRWHRYIDLDPCKKLEMLLKEVDDDPTGIFWG